MNCFKVKVRFVTETNRKVAKARLNRAIVNCARMRVNVMKQVKILVDKINERPE